MGRPPVSNPRCERLAVRLTKSEAAEVRRKAKAQGQTMSEYILANILRG